MDLLQLMILFNGTLISTIIAMILVRHEEKKKRKRLNQCWKRQ